MQHPLAIHSGLRSIVKVEMKPDKCIALYGHIDSVQLSRASSGYSELRIL